MARVTLHHVGVLVPRMDDAIRWFEQTLGVAVNTPQQITSLNRIDPGEFGDEETHQSVSYIAWSQDGPPYFEIVQGKDGPDGMSSLAKHGPGLYHVGTFVQDVDVEIARLDALGIGLQGRVLGPDGRTVTCWTQPSPLTELAVELMDERMREPIQGWIDTERAPQVAGTTH